MADVIIVYDTKTGTTGQAAALILEGVKAAGVDGATIQVQDVTEQDLRAAKGIVLGSPNVNDNYTGSMRDFVEGKLRTARWAGKVGAAFGTYKWNTANLRNLEKDMQYYTDMRLVTPGVNATHRLDQNDSDRLKDLGERIGREVLKMRA